MPVLLFVAFVLVPIAELYVLIQVGQQIGVLATIALLIADSLLGAWLLRREGSRAWRALRAALAAHRLPAREVADGALVIFGGALLLTPGFLSDILGLLCILPPSRAVLRRVLTGVVAARFGVAGSVAGLAAEGLAARRRRPAAPGDASDIIDGVVLDSPGNAAGPPPEGDDPGRR